jgi:hypothetical protein
MVNTRQNVWAFGTHAHQLCVIANPSQHRSLHALHWLASLHPYQPHVLAGKPLQHCQLKRQLAGNSPSSTITPMLAFMLAVLIPSCPAAACCTCLLLHLYPCCCIFLPVRFSLTQPAEIYVDDEAKLTLHGLVQHYVMLHEEEKNRKLTDLLDALDFNQVCGQTMDRSWHQPFCSPVAAWYASQPDSVSMLYADANSMSCQRQINVSLL